ncbi:MAG: HDOD domain-containing protein [Magnetococcales bacterium]|nr:HDOD domain-containing protein [Magnetococcales bacterium]
MAYSKKKLLRLVAGIPAFPHSIYQLMRITSDINFSPKELINIIDHDPVLTLNILKMVNSPYFGFSQSIGSINQAVVCAGINTIKNLALSLAPLELLSSKNREVPALNQLLIHSLATGSIAKKLARNLGVPETDATDYFVGGLLHDVGKVALFKAIPKKYGKIFKKAAFGEVPLEILEKKALGLNHNDVGNLLAKRWNLPADVRYCMGGYRGRAKENKNSQMLACVQAADLIATRLDFGYSGAFEIADDLPVKLQERFGKSLNELIISLGVISDEINKTRMIIQLKRPKEGGGGSLS